MSSTHAVGVSSLPRALGRRRPRWHVRFFARLRAPWLDRQLASGIVTWRSPSHAARALQLTRDRKRRSLACSLERLVKDAEQRPTPCRGAAVLVCREQVREASPLILTICSQLRSSIPVDARGIAKLHDLLCDGCGPCYARIRPDALTVALQAVLQSLDVTD